VPWWQKEYFSVQALNLKIKELKIVFETILCIHSQTNTQA